MVVAIKNMIKTIWQKIKQNHWLMTVICCLAPLILIIGLLSLFKGRSDYWLWLMILLCPLMHIFMMRGHKHSESCNHQDSVLYKCPECGLEYQEKEWAEKCEAWCRKNKSCNLEITKHSIQN
jgi:beta-lactamase regulating signal transducer with metallopeptidase domain